VSAQCVGNAFAAVNVKENLLEAVVETFDYGSDGFHRFV